MAARADEAELTFPTAIHVENFDGGRSLECVQGLLFATEPLGGLRFARRLRSKHLDRDRALCPMIERAIDDALPAAADLTEQLVSLIPESGRLRQRGNASTGWASPVPDALPGIAATVPEPFEGVGTEVTKVWAGYSDTCVRKRDETVWCWGARLGGTPTQIAEGCEEP
jgi:hypothetical protein